MTDSGKKRRMNSRSRFKRIWAGVLQRARWLGAEGGCYVEDWMLLLEHYAPDDRCLACGEIRSLAVDHVVPLTQGGSCWPDNLQPLCKSCNSSKGDQTIDYRPDRGEFSRPMTERLKKEPGSWQKILYLRPIWEKRSKERGVSISYGAVSDGTGFRSDYLYRWKFGYGGLPERRIINVFCDFFFCRPGDIVLDAIGLEPAENNSYGDIEQLSLFDGPVVECPYRINRPYSWRPPVRTPILPLPAAF